MKVGKKNNKAITAESNGSIEDRYGDAINATMVGFLFEHIYQQVLVNPVLGSAIVWLNWDVYDRRVLVVWFFVLLASLLLRYLLYRMYWRIRPAGEDAYIWGLLFAVTVSINGIIWGYAGWMFFSTEHVPQTIVLIIIIAGIASGSYVTHSSFVPAYIVFPFLAVVPLAIRFFMEGQFEFAVVGIFCLIFIFFLVFPAKKAHRYLKHAVGIQFKLEEMNDELASKREEAERANAAKSKFLASASHDLRQPVHAIQLFIDVLGGMLSNAKEKEVVKSIKCATDSLENIFTGLLDFSKVDAKVIEPEFEVMAVNSLLVRLRDEFEPLAWDKGLDFRLVNSTLVVKTDPTILERILRNLISNAVRYTIAGSVLVGCRRKGDSVCIQVWDTGIGIPSGKQDLIFTEFYQVNNTERDQSKGLGLGLAITAGLAKLLGTKIEIFSVEEKGSCFSIRIPIVDAVPIESVENEEYQYTQKVLSGELVVFIDDERTIRDAMSHLFEMWGCQGVIAEDIDELEQKLADYGDVPKLIIADYRLRDNKTGIESIARLREQYDKEIPAIIVTGDTAPDRLKEASEFGAVLIHKPIRPSDLYKLMVQLICDPTY